MIGFLGMFGFLEYSTRSSFCNSCHIMKPYYEGWKKSSHSNVACVKCHYPPDIQDTMYLKFQASSQLIKYITKTYGSKPYAEIDDSSCLRSECHELSKLKDNVEFKKGVTFDHTPHLTEMRRQKKLRCTSCHSQVVQDDHISVTTKSCFLCHFKNADKNENKHMTECTNCHNDIPETVTHEGRDMSHADYAGRGVKCEKCHGTMIVGEGKVARATCTGCHNDPEHLKFYDQDIVLHKKHVTEHSVDCLQCHGEIDHKITSTVRSMDTSCGSCHSDMHNAQQLIYTGSGGIGVDDLPSPMFMANVDCKGCHFKHTVENGKAKLSGQSRAATEAACIGCHTSDIEGIMDEWIDSIDEILSESQVNLASAERALLRARKQSRNGADIDLEEIERIYRAAKRNYELVFYGRGVHNVEYAMELLLRCDEDCDKIQGMVN